MRLPELGDDFGRYRLDRELGRGGMGIVYAAHDTALDRSVALKLITPQWAEDPDYRARFEREALSLSKVESPHVVAVHDYGELDGCLYLVTQVVPDGDLLQLVRREGPLAPAAALDVAAGLLDGLNAAHSVGVVHRDVKPSNVLLRRRDGRLEAVLCDFGIATSPGGDVTRTGGLVGSFPYMAPERHQGQEADAAADVYSVGCVLWQTLTGTAPYVGSDVEIAMAHLQAPVPQLPAVDDFSRALNVVLARALAKDPADRYRSARAMRAELLSVAELAPGALELPETTSVRHVIVPGVVPGVVPGAVREPQERRTRRPGVAILAAMVAVVLAVAGTYAAVAVGSADDGVEVIDVASRTLPTAVAPDPATTPPTTPPATPPATEADPSPGAAPSSGSDTRRQGATRKQRNQGAPSSGLGVVTGPGPGESTPNGPTSGSPATSSPPSSGSRDSGPRDRGPRNRGPRKDGDKPSSSPTRTPTSTPTKAPPPPPPATFRCWQGSETYGPDECPALSGVAGLHWVYPNHYKCVDESRTGGPRRVILTCERKTKFGAAQIRYTLWRSVPDAVDFFAGQYAKSSQDWRDGWGYTWFQQTPKATMKVQRSHLYADAPVSVVLRGVNLDALQQVMGTVQYRDPAYLRGVPL